MGDGDRHRVKTLTKTNTPRLIYYVWHEKLATFTLLSVKLLWTIDTHGAVPSDLFARTSIDSNIKAIADHAESKEIRVDDTQGQNGKFLCDDRAPESPRIDSHNLV